MVDPDAIAEDIRPLLAIEQELFQVVGHDDVHGRPGFHSHGTRDGPPAEHFCRQPVSPLAEDWHSMRESGQHAVGHVVRAQSTLAGLGIGRILRPESQSVARADRTGPHPRELGPCIASTEERSVRKSLLHLRLKGVVETVTRRDVQVSDIQHVRKRTQGLRHGTLE